MAGLGTNGNGVQGLEYAFKLIRAVALMTLLSAEAMIFFLEPAAAQQYTHRFSPAESQKSLNNETPEGVRFIAIVNVDGEKLQDKLRLSIKSKRSIVLLLPNMKPLRYKVEKANRTPSGGWVFNGYANGKKINSGSIITYNGSVGGWIDISGRRILIESIDFNTSSIQEVDWDYEPIERRNLNEDNKNNLHEPLFEPKVYLQEWDNEKEQEDGMKYIDSIAFVANRARSVPGYTEIIHNQQVALHFALIDAGSSRTIRFRALGVIAIDESKYSMDYILRLASNSSLIAQLRKERKADIVTVFVNKSDLCGLANYNQSPSASTKHKAFSVVSISPACSGNYSFAHEIGHNLGLRHSRWDVKSEGGSGHKDKSTYNFGYSNLEGRVRDIMAYAGECKSKGYSCKRIPRFSDPTYKYAGKYRLGLKASDGLPANAAKRLRKTIEAVAAYY